MRCMKLLPAYSISDNKIAICKDRSRSNEIESAECKIARNSLGLYQYLKSGFTDGHQQTLSTAILIRPQPLWPQYSRS